MANRKLGIAIIGAGAVANIHIESYKSYPEHAEIRAVCDLFVEKAQATQKNPKGSKKADKSGKKEAKNQRGFRK